MPDAFGALSDAEDGTVETLEQMQAQGTYPDYVYMTSGGKGQAGLVLAKRLLEAPFLVHGVTVSHEYEVPTRTAGIANDTLDVLGLDLRIAPDEVISFADHAASYRPPHRSARATNA